MEPWPDEALEKRMLANAGPAFIWIKSLIERVRELEKREAELTQLARNAHEACCVENMPCPWCSGRCEPFGKEEHDEFCPWPNLEVLKE